MPPKKPAAGTKGSTSKLATEAFTQCGLFSEACQLPLWEDDDHSWGDLTAAVDSGSLFVDPEWQHPHVGYFGGFVSEWKRPAAIFSPFKPVVYRPVVAVNPYEWDASKGEALLATTTSGGPGGPLQEEDEQPKLASKAEAVAHYRNMKSVRLPQSNEDPSVDLSGTGLNLSMVVSPSRRNPGIKKAGGKLQVVTPFFMRVLNSSLMVINQVQHLIPQGQYAWELIHPQNPVTGFPLYNPAGKYAVRLWVGGAFRRVVIDDRFPTDANGQCMLTVTEQKEVWPALLAKAMLKALGPQHEKLLFHSPTWVLETLLAGWAPQILSPCNNELQTLRVLRQAIDHHRASGQVGGEAVLIATCGDSSEADTPVPEPDDHYTVGAGFHPNQAFHILDVRPYHNTSLLRLCAPGAQWKGQYHYGSNLWSEIESTLGFTQQDRNAADLMRKWNDFWMSWEQFTKYFRSVVAFRKIVDEKRYHVFKQIAYPPEIVPDAKPPAKGAVAVVASPAPERGVPKTVVKWLYSQHDSSYQLLCCFIGLPRLREKDGVTLPLGPSVISVHSYVWSRSVPFTFVARMVVNPMTHQCTTINIPSGPCAYRITVENLPPDCAVSLMGPAEITVGEEREVCKDLLDITTTNDAGVYGECKPDFTTLWFKRHVTVKQPTKCCFVLTTLPKGADLSQYRTAPTEPAAAAKSKAPAKAAKGSSSKGEPQPTDVAVEEIDDGTSHTLPIITFAHLAVLNMDNGVVLYNDTIGKILNATLVPNKAGYALVASATPPEHYGKGYWRLTCTTDRPLESFEPRTFDEVVTKSGEYAHNDVSSLLRYNMSVAEPATATIQLRVKEAIGIPFTLELFHNDKLLEKRDEVRSCFLHNINLLPPADKTSPSTYAIHVTLASAYTQTWEEQRRDHVVSQYEKDCREQEEHLLRQQAELRTALRKDPAATASPEFSGPRPGSVATHGANISYTLAISSSTSKLELKEDNSINEQLTAVKASWSRGSKEEVEVVKGKAAPKPGKGQPVVDEAAARFQKAKESRDRFLANRKGVFIPYAQAPSPSNGGPAKLFLSAEDETSARFVPMSIVQDYQSPTRLHGGVTAAGTILHGGVQSAAPPKSVQGTAATTRPPTSKLLETCQAEINARREARRALATEVQQAIAGFWSVVKPEAKPEPAEGDDAKRKQSKPRK